jgi:hypothetical protein
VRLKNRRILEQWKPMRDEPTRAFDSRCIGPTIARVRVELRRRCRRGVSESAAATATTATSSCICRYLRGRGTSSATAAPATSASSAPRSTSRRRRLALTGSAAASSTAAACSLLRARRPFAAANSETAAIDGQGRPSGHTGKIVTGKIRISESFIGRRRAEVTDVAEGRTHLVREQLGEGLSQPRTGSEDERLPSDRLPGVQDDRLETPIRNL